MNIIFDYFNDYYLHAALPLMPISEFFFLSCCIIVFNDYPLKWKSVPLFLLNLIIGWSALIILKAILKQTDFNMTYSYMIFAVIYMLIMGHKRLFNNFIYFNVLWTAYVFASTFAKSAGLVLFSYILNMAYTQTATYITIAIVLPIICVGFSAICKLFPLDKYKRIDAYYIILPVIINLAANIAKILVDSTKGEGIPFFNLSEQESGIFIFLLGLLLYLLNLIGYLFCLHQAKNSLKYSNLQSEVENLKKEKNSIKNSSELFNHNLEEMRSIRHDFKNQIAYLQIMMASKDYKKLEEYFNEFNKNISPILNTADCENPTIRNIINLENNKIKNSGIAINSKIIAPEQIGIADSDLTSLLLNLLDNAIEACLEDKNSHAVIEFNMMKKDSYLYVNVVNPIIPSNKNERRNKLETAKEQKQLHERGTKIIDYIAKKYDGVFTHKIEDDKFIADVMLLIKEEKNG